MQRALWAVALTAAALFGETGFLDRAVEVNGQTHFYQVYVPRDYAPTRVWPVILFLHGAGESGANGLTQTQVGLPGAIRKNPERFPAIVVMPQSSPTRQWMDPAEQAVALAALEASRKEFRTDAGRIYLTGLSKGGYGTWHLAAREPNRFAAIAPICGGVVFSKRLLERLGKTEADFPTNADVAQKLGRTLPIWAFHGGADPTVPPEASRSIIEALKAIGSNARYTEYEGVGHNSWDRAYGDPAFAEWLFAQKRVVEH
ncbi:MAG TPA: prolyl oligopeptidase family serine peptidase [Bryobacteraceae bacterium]|nr:prolyl oligopeptidase family serine peptidase [Bryobacteraceae bacterium]